MYFLRREASVELTVERARSLRTSLNSPVVASPELPPGPARAAILVHTEPSGAVSVSVGVRSIKTADAATWTCDADLNESTRVDVAVDAAMSFAEGMGFLFDDGEPDEGRRATSGWTALMGDANETDAILELTELVPIEVEEGSSEPVLDWDDSEDLPDLQLADGPGFDLEQATFEEAAPSVPLSKFRNRLPTAETADSPDAAPQPAAKRAAAPKPPGSAKPAKAAGKAAPKSRAALGKLKLIKRRGDAAAKRRAWLQRVLSSF
jgi:hypothetical protein